MGHGGRAPGEKLLIVGKNMVCFKRTILNKVKGRGGALEAPAQRPTVLLGNVRALGIRGRCRTIPTLGREGRSSGLGVPLGPKPLTSTKGEELREARYEFSKT